MPRVALVAELAFVLVAFVWRGWLQYRRTGDHGFRGLSGTIGSPEWCGGVLLILGALAAFAAPVSELTGSLQPAAFLNRPLVHALGLAAVTLGCILTILAQLQMGASWRVGVDQREVTALVTHGLFRYARNPIYTAMLVAFCGLILLVPNPIAVSGGALAFAGLELHVRLVEEPYLLRVHGEAYRRYARTVGRFLPGLGRFTGDAASVR